MPTDRPTFEELSNKLNHFLKLENTQDEQFIDLQKLYDKYTSEMWVRKFKFNVERLIIQCSSFSSDILKELHETDCMILRVEKLCII